MTYLFYIAKGPVETTDHLHSKGNNTVCPSNEVCPFSAELSNLDKSMTRVEVYFRDWENR
jgi:hypothetical protein